MGWLRFGRRRGQQLVDKVGEYHDQAGVWKERWESGIPDDDGDEDAGAGLEEDTGA